MNDPKTSNDLNELNDLNEQQGNFINQWQKKLEESIVFSNLIQIIYLVP